MNINDLLSTADPLQDPNASSKRSRSDTVQGPQEIPIPTISSLISQFPDRNTLYAHLATLPKPILISMLLSQAKDLIPAPEAQSFGPSNNLAHCVYCHRLFDKGANLFDCKVKHFGNLEEGDDADDDTKVWSCCGLVVVGYCEDVVTEPFHAPPEESESPYCWEGRHHGKELEDGNTDAKGIWWREWNSWGKKCEKLGCHTKFNGGHLTMWDL